MNARTLFAYTAADEPVFPPYFNATLDGNEVVITVRSAAVSVDGVRVCGRTCHPGREGCNNYCNRAPEVGSMAHRPQRLVHKDAGVTATMRMPRAVFESLVAATGVALPS